MNEGPSNHRVQWPGRPGLKEVVDLFTVGQLARH